MGRKNWKEFVSEKGPGRKAKKQGDPELPLQLQEQDKHVKKVKSGAVGGRIKQRARKRASVAALAKASKQGAKGSRSKEKYAAVPPPPPPPMEEEEEEEEMMTGLEADVEEAPAHSPSHDPIKMELFKGGSDGSSGKS